MTNTAPAPRELTWEQTLSALATAGLIGLESVGLDFKPTAIRVTYHADRDPALDGAERETIRVAAVQMRRRLEEFGDILLPPVTFGGLRAAPEGWAKGTSRGGTWASFDVKRY